MIENIKFIRVVYYIVIYLLPPSWYWYWYTVMVDRDSIVSVSRHLSTEKIHICYFRFILSHGLKYIKRGIEIVGAKKNKRFIDWFIELKKILLYVDYKRKRENLLYNLIRISSATTSTISDHAATQLRNPQVLISIGIRICLDFCGRIFVNFANPNLDSWSEIRKTLRYYFSSKSVNRSQDII